jgi:large subunit ribosomal protein L5
MSLNEVKLESIPSTLELYRNFRNQYSINNKMNIMSVPRLKYIVLSAGLGKHRESDKFKKAISDLSNIACQKVMISKARKSVSNFKLREGAEIGIYTTLRREKMFRFLDEMIVIALHRDKNFTGLSINSFDKSNNLNFGLKSQHAFMVPISTFSFGMNICIGISAKNKIDAIRLIEAIRIPFIQNTEALK